MDLMEGRVKGESRSGISAAGNDEAWDRKGRDSPRHTFRVHTLGCTDSKSLLCLVKGRGAQLGDR